MSARSADGCKSVVEAVDADVWTQILFMQLSSAEQRLFLHERTHWLLIHDRPVPQDGLFMVQPGLRLETREGVGGALAQTKTNIPTRITLQTVYKTRLSSLFSTIYTPPLQNQPLSIKSFWLVKFERKWICKEMIRDKVLNEFNFQFAEKPE